MYVLGVYNLNIYDKKIAPNGGVILVFKNRGLLSVHLGQIKTWLTRNLRLLFYFNFNSFVFV